MRRPSRAIMSKDSGRLGSQKRPPGRSAPLRSPHASSRLLLPPPELNELRAHPCGARRKKWRWERSALRTPTHHPTQGRGSLRVSEVVVARKSAVRIPRGGDDRRPAGHGGAFRRRGCSDGGGGVQEGAGRSGSRKLPPRPAARGGGRGEGGNREKVAVNRRELRKIAPSHPIWTPSKCGASAFSCASRRRLGPSRGLVRSSPTGPR